MPTITAVPGVFIEEEASPAISVSTGATSVPLFVGRFTPLKPELAGVITRISSWLDFSTQFDITPQSSAQVVVTSTRTAGKAPAKDTFTYQISRVDLQDKTASVALQLYFQNGGGPCYLYPLGTSGDSNQLAALPNLIDDIGDITLLVSPDSDEAYRNAVYTALIPTLNQNKGYFLLADSQNGQVPVTVKGSAHVAVYYPPLVMPYARQINDAEVVIKGYVDGSANPAATLSALRNVNKELAKQLDQSLLEKKSAPIMIPPSPLMAGVYCGTDRERGVWKSPANVVLSGVSEASVRITNDQQETMNKAGINVIRCFSDRGLVVWGSRTQLDNDDWRYIPVRRLFDTVQRDVRKALRPMIFEPNSQPTWKRVQAAIDSYLYRLWQQGGLVGNKAEEAYFVRIGKGSTMTQDEINQGKMIIQIGMAAVRPAEFIILKFTQDMSQ